MGGSELKANSAKSPRWRSALFASVLVASGIGVSGAVLRSPSGYAAGVIATENAKPGDGIQGLDAATAGKIEGYAAAQSINVGGSLPISVSSSVGAFDIQVFRLGWYGGVGARKVFTATGIPGAARTKPAPDANGMVAANWPVSYTLATDTSWVTGLYIVALHKSGVAGPASYLPFVLRDDSSSAPFVHVAPFNTYQAYNAWGGKSLYTFNSTGPQARKVSFDRPFDAESGAGFMFEGDWYLAQFNEREGYEVSYAASADLELNPSLLANHKAFLSTYHDEYWTAAMRSNLESAIAQGKHAAFFGANSVYWQVRYENAADGRRARTMVGYKENWASDPVQGATTTGRFRDAPANKPENALLGSMYEADFGYGSSVPWVVTNAAHWMYAGTGLKNGDQIPKVVGYEWDRVFDNGLTPPGLITLSDSTPQPGFKQQATLYQKGGALVFNASTIYWPWLLTNTSWGVDARIQQMTKNLLNAMTNPAGPPTTTAPPTTAEPASTTTIPAGQTVVNRWDFEDGTTQGWGPWWSGSTGVPVSTNPHTGTKSLRVSGADPATTGIELRTLIPGVTYTLKGFSRNDLTTYNLGEVQFYGASSSTTTPIVFTPSGRWNSFQATFTVPAGTAQVFIGLNGGASPVQFDDITLATGAAVATTTTTTTIAGTTTTIAGTTTTIVGATTTRPPAVPTTSTIPPIGGSIVGSWDFETGTQNWSTWYGTGTVARTTTGVRSGAGALRVTTGGYATAGVLIPGLLAGSQYRLRGYMRNDLPTFNVGEVQFWGSTTPAPAITFTNEGAWTRFDATFTVPAGISNVFVAINGGEFPLTIDDVTLSTGTSTPPTTTSTTTTTRPVTTTVTTTTTTTTRPPTTTTRVPATTTPPTTTSTTPASTSTTTTTTTRPPTTSTSTTTTTTTTTTPPTTTTTTTPPTTTTTTTTTPPTTTIPTGSTLVNTWDFENGTTQGWTIWYGTGTATPTKVGARTGTGALRLTTGNYATAGLLLGGLTPNQRYTIRGYSKNDSPTFNVAELQFWGSTAASPAVSFTPEGVWNRFEVTFTVPAGVYYTFLGVNGGASPLTIDDVTLSALA